MSRANLGKNPGEVAAMFDGVAQRYDIMNDLLSFGRARAWRRVATKIIAPAPGMKILDLAAGTGSSSEPLHRAGATVLATDFSDGMLAQGRRMRPYLSFSKADALHLPFMAESFDVTTISFGLRNTVDYPAALIEARRVTKTGGRIVVVEFSHPTWPPFRRLYMRYLMGALPAIARRSARNPDAYIYLAESIRAWPDQEGLASAMRAAGWGSIAWKDLSGGVVAVHSGIKAER